MGGEVGAAHEYGVADLWSRPTTPMEGTMKKIAHRARLLRVDSKAPRFRAATVTYTIFQEFARLRRAERATLGPWTRATSFRLDRSVAAFELAQHYLCGGAQ